MHKSLWECDNCGKSIATEDYGIPEGYTEIRTRAVVNENYTNEVFVACSPKCVVEIVKDWAKNRPA